METKIQLKHPAGKKAVSMDENKYDVIKQILIKHLGIKGESTHAEILQAITEDFKKNKTPFEGAVEWHMEWVKLDLEANNIIERVKDSSGLKFRLKK